MARRPTARNQWIGDWLRANRSTDMAAANAAYKRFHGGGGRGALVLGGVRSNPAGRVPLWAWAALGVAAYAASPTVQGWVNPALDAIKFPVSLRPTSARAV